MEEVMDESVKVLLVDDKEENLNALASMLEPSGADLVRARSAEEALLALVEHEFAAIVLDIRMPGMDGLELARLVKQRKRTQHVPILFLTAHMIDERDALRGYDVGAVDYLSKPVNPGILRSKIGVFIELFSKSRELVAANAALRLESAERERIAAELRTANNALEARVEMRTAEAVAASRAAQYSEERLRQALAGARAGVWEYDFLRYESRWSPEMFELHGLEPGQGSPTTKQFMAFVHPEDRPATVSASRDATERGGPFELEFRVIRPDDGRVVWINCKGVVDHDRDGRAVATRGVNQDVTVRKSIEQALRDSEKRIRVANEAAGLGTYVADLQTGRIRYGPYLCQVLGLPPGTETPLRDGLRFVHPDDREKLRAALEAASDPAGDGRSKLELRVVRPGREVRWYSFSAQFDFQDTPRGRVPVGQVGAIFDITERKLAETALQEADRRKDQFLATLAHELRNPLAPLRNGLQLLQISRDDGEVTEKVHEMMNRQVNHLVRLVDDLLEVSRITRGKILLRREPSDLSTLVRNAVETARPLIETGRHTLELELLPERLIVDADPVRLVQVFANLLNNAAKFTEPAGKISVSMARDGASAVVRIRDNGVGISAEMLPRVVDVFVQADEGQSRSQGGLGIGLSLARTLVEMHGGSIEAHSSGVGAGSEFSVRLPLSAQPRPSEPKRLGAA
jgi:PAS domain S-box-containing protein